MAKYRFSLPPGSTNPVTRMIILPDSEQTEAIGGWIMMLELETLSLKELQRLQKDVEAAISGFKDREKRKALAEVEAFARERGLTAADLADITGRKARKTVGSARYANPADPAQTWTGRGRKPGWVVAALAAGTALDELAL